MVSAAEILFKKGAFDIFAHIAGEIQAVTIKKDNLQGCRILRGLAELDAPHFAERLQLVAQERQ